MTDFRALCVELLTDYEQNRFRVELAAEARASLSEQPVTPTDEELRELWNDGWDTTEWFGALQFARAVLRRWGQQ